MGQSMAVFQVSTIQELSTALKQAKGGDEIKLAAGHYGDLSVRNTSFSSAVTITAADVENPPVFNTIGLWKVDKLTFDGIFLDFVPTATTLEWSTAFKASHSSDISVINSTLTGGPAVAGIDPDLPAGSQGASGIKGLPIGAAMGFLWSTNITVENNTISEFSAGVRFNSVDGIVFNGNEIHDVRKVPVGGADVDNVVMEGNYFHDLVPWKLGGLGDHSDFVHFWTTPTQTEPSSNMVFKDNLFVQGDGAAPLGIYLDNNNNTTGFENIVVQGNVIHNGSAGGLRMEDVNGLQILDNTFLQSSGGPKNAPNILLDEGTKNVLIDGNILPGIAGLAMNDPSGNNIVIADNVIVQIHDPLAANYAGNLFVNGLAHKPTLADLRPIPGSMADGYGASGPAQGETSGAAILSDRGSGLALSTHDFSLINIADPLAVKALQGATVVWDFGNGKTGQGVQTAHSYDLPGTYSVKASVTLASGETFQTVKAVEVLTPVAIAADFDTGLVDNSPSPQHVIQNGSIKLESSEKGQSVRLEGDRSTVKFQASEDLLNNQEFTISLGFKKDVGAEAGGGRVLYFSGTAVIEVTANGVILRASTSEKESITLRSGDIGLRDSDWHQITYVFSQKDGTALLYVDGSEVARVEGLTGMQHTTSGHDLHMGNLFGPNMKGLLDDAVFLRAAVTPEDVASAYKAFQKNEEPAYLQIAGNAEQPLASVPAKVSIHDMDFGGLSLDFSNLDNLSYTLKKDVKIQSGPEGHSAWFGGNGGNIVLGRQQNLEQSDRIAMSVDFKNDDPDGGVARLVWNHTRFGVSVDGDKLLVSLSTTSGFKHYTVENLGLGDGKTHSLTILLDDKEDRLQVIVDDMLVLQDTSTNFDNEGASSRQWGWSIGTSWNRHFEGEVSAFTLGDKFDFVEDFQNQTPDISIV